MIKPAEPLLFEQMSALADPLRGRIVLVLERQEMTVTEISAVFQLPQSTMSRHLKALVDAGLLVWRAEGTSRRYTMPTGQLEAASSRLWQLAREEVAATAAAEQDAARVRSVLSRRRTRSQEFFSTAAGEWDRMRAELFGTRADLRGLLGLLPRDWTVGDLGCGTGQITDSLAPFVGRVLAVDDSPEMVAAARRRLAGLDNVEVRLGQIEALPLEEETVDAAVLLLVLHFLPDPARAFGEAARVLKPGGRVLVVDMTPHDREDYRQRMGHVWLGFGPEQMEGWMNDAGFRRVSYTPLPPDPEAKGPALFAATGEL